MEFTYDELCELSYLVWGKKTKLRADIERYADYDGAFEGLIKRAEQKFELFKGLEAKLEKMKLASLETV